MTAEADVLVVGAGIAGLSRAVALPARGISSVLCPSSPASRTSSSIPPRTVE